MTGPTGTTSPPGLDLDALGRWMSAAVPGAGPDLSATLLAGGRSNLTYRVTDGVHEWVVRRPPLGHVLATAHDMAREHRVLNALRGTEVPVPPTHGLCEDPAVVGAPFFVMDFVPGTAYTRAADLALLGAERTRSISADLVDVLAALHRVDPAAVGLADFGRPAGFLARQVKRWAAQLAASRSRELPAADELHGLLAGRVPAESAAAIVHGDYRLDNALVAGARVVGVLDWEMATLGDPLTDLALLVLYQRLGELTDDPVIADVARAPGYLQESEVLARYAGASGRDVSRFPFYLGLAAFKLAVVLEGIQYRYLQGQTVGEGFAAAGSLVGPILDVGLAAMKEDR